MSSSLLLGNFVIGDQHKPIRGDPTSLSPIKRIQYYNEREQEYFEETSNYPMPVASVDNNVKQSNQKLRKCTCCPYGYHIDLDFIRYCEELATNGKRPTSRQLDRRNKRRQRKSLEMMLGFDDQWLLEYEKDLPKQQSSQFQTVYEVFDILEEQVSSPYENVNCSEKLKQNFAEHTVTNKEHTNQTEHGDFVNNILFDVYSDFERTLERAESGNRKKSKQTSSCISGHDSYDNEKQLDLEIVHCPTRIVDRSSAGLSYENVLQQDIIIEEVQAINKIRRSEIDAMSIQRTDDSASKPKPVSTTINVEIDKLSLANRKLSDQLQSVRNQLSDNLNRVRDFEERVKQIPKLQLELSVEKAENRDLHLKLKELKTKLEKKDAHDMRNAMERRIDTIETETMTNNGIKLNESITMKPFNAHRVCATSLESLNIRFPSSSPTESHLSQTTATTSQLKFAPSTQNVGCMTNAVISRDIGILTMPVQIPTRSIALNTDISGTNPFEKPRPIMKSVSIQCEYEIKTRRKSVATETEPPSPPVEKYSIAVMAKPTVISSSCMIQPDVRTIGLDNIYQNIRTRSFGTDPIKHLIEMHKAAESDSPISLKLLDAPKTQRPEPNADGPPEIQKEFRSMGVQSAPSVAHKMVQCKEKPVEPPPKVPIRNESTDTSDLTLHIHRAVNTDAVPHKENRLTNTDRISTDEKSTNTIIAPNTNTNSLGINTDLSGIGTDIPTKDEIQSTHLDLDQQCHDCLAKIEIKQRTIIKNPKHTNKDNIDASTASHTLFTKLSTENTTTTELHESNNDEVFNTSSQSTDLQSRIPRPTALISPRSEKKFIRQNTYTIPNSPLPSPDDGDEATPTTVCPAEVYFTSTSGAKENTSTTHSQTSIHRSVVDVENKSQYEFTSSDISTAGASSTGESSKRPQNTLDASEKSTSYNNDEDDEPKLWSHSMKPSTTFSQLASRPRQKVNPSKEMQAALKVINDSLLKGQHLATTLKNANKLVQKEWFRISSTENAQPFEVEDYLDCFEEYSTNLLKYMVNSTDANGNTAMHYAVSHGNFDVVSILLDSKVCNINSTNNAGYTCVMLVSLAKLDISEHQNVVQRLFQIADVNVRAKKHSQTALMLATSHGNYNMVRMLLDAGADINIQDEDGSTALMCAAEHGRMDIIKILLAQSDCDSTIQDLDGSTALKISLEAGYRDIGVLLYAHEYMIKNKSPYTSSRNGGRSRKPSSSLTSSTNILHGSTSNSNVASKTNTSEMSNIDSSKHIS